MSAFRMYRYTMSCRDIANRCVFALTNDSRDILSNLGIRLSNFSQIFSLLGATGVNVKRSNSQYYILLYGFLLVQGALIWFAYLIGQYHGVSAVNRYTFPMPVKVLEIDEARDEWESLF
ncbi:hypothetical protein M8J75_012334 [Diaphorina citri]|nr:hypothetical protein M8J75_012334 [Diaphorina citri]KAI5727532.1 hypothetical protein M8J77_003401 [Diaphorina citri]